MIVPASDLVLASGSAVRCRILRDAGVPFRVRPSSVDEHVLKVACRSRGLSVDNTAVELAAAKAGQVSGLCPGSFVLGADQMLDCDRVWFDKPDTLEKAVENLLFFSGKTHRLVCGISLYHDGECLWKTSFESFMTMRCLGKNDVDRYLEKAGPDVLTSVGAYQVEALGINLFERMEGDWFTILGLPLLPVLAVLREHGVVDL